MNKHLHEIKAKDLVIWNLTQAVEALGCTNRYYFYEQHGREANCDEELIVFYANHGGAKNFRERKPQ
jgi:hypothetical protein